MDPHNPHPVNNASGIIFKYYFLLLLEVVLSTKVSHYPFHQQFGRTKIKQLSREEFIFPNSDVVNRFKRQEWGETLGPVYNPSWSFTFGMGFDSKIRQQFQREQEEYRLRNGGFLPPSACPENRPYIFYCDPRDRTGPINPVTGQRWPNGIYFPISTSTTTISSRQLLVRPPCDSILCPVGGNEGYGYTGLEDVVGKTYTENMHERKCTSLLCVSSKLKRYR